MKSVEWKTYRTRFLVQAKQLDAALSFVDSLGRQHFGRKGDYLVESSEGVLTITPRRIFEDIYVPMLGPQPENKLSVSQIEQMPVERLPVHEVRVPTPPMPDPTGQHAQAEAIDPKNSSIESSTRLRKKQPQSFRDRRPCTSAPQIGLM